MFLQNMNLMQPLLYINLICFIIFFLYILLYKSYTLSTSNIRIPHIFLTSLIKSCFKKGSLPNSKITTPELALAELIKGNKKYKSFWNFAKKANRKSVATIQRPFVIVLSCSDSRVPTEIIFNQLNLGNMFIIRNAGNVVDGVVLGSIEYGVAQLGALLIMVLGHERCGAVTATIDAVLENRPEQSGHIKDIINAIRPAAHNILEKNKCVLMPDEVLKVDIINQTVTENVRLVIENLYKDSDIIAQALDTKKIKIVGAFYNLDDGNIQIME